MGTKEQNQVESSEKRYRWLMLFLVSLLYATFGMVTRSVSPLVTPILKDLHISHSQMGVIMGSWQLTYIVVAVIGGALIDRWGIRKSLLFGILIIGLSEVLRGFANGFVTMFLFVALFGLGGPMISIGCPKTIAEWFRGKERGIAVGIYTASVPIGGLTALSTINAFVMPLTGYSWRLTFVWYGLLPFAAALLWWWLAKDAKPTAPSDSKGTAADRNTVKVFSSLIRIPNIQLILAMGLLTFFINHGFTNWLPNILETGGLPSAIAGVAASIPLVVGIPVAILIPRLVSPQSRGRAIALLSLVAAVAVLLIVRTSGALLVIGLIAKGLFSCITPLLILTLMDMPEVGARYMGSASGMYFCVAEIGGFAGPFIFGVAKDLAGNFLAGATILAVLALGLLVMALLLKTQPASATKKAQI